MEILKTWETTENTGQTIIKVNITEYKVFDNHMVLFFYERLWDFWNIETYSYKKSDLNKAQVEEFANYFNKETKKEILDYFS